MPEKAEFAEEIETIEGELLGAREAMATIAVKDLQVARDFYVGKLGLKTGGPAGSGVLTLESGKSKVIVYESEFAGTNKATAATWRVGVGLEAIVEDLKQQGISFEHYDMPHTRLEGDIHVSGKMKVAWLKDPDGNILSLVGG